MKKLGKNEMKNVTGGVAAAGSQLYYCLLHDTSGEMPDQQFLCTGCASVELNSPTDTCRQLVNAAAGVPITY